MKILVVGSGGREDAILWKLAQSPRASKLFVAPGNPGASQWAEVAAIQETDVPGLARFAKENRIDLTVVGPDNPLALGIADAFTRHGLRIFGPTRAAAEIESSKAFAKELMKEAGIPTAAFRIFCEHSEALAYVRKRGAPIVVKASGLARGKGVYICKTLVEAEHALTEIMLARIHKGAGDEVVIEEFLDGQEISIHALSHGTASILLPPAQDHKVVGENDEGENTGGMGVIAPVPWVTAEMMRRAKTTIVDPALTALAELGRPFIGCLYPGLKVTTGGLRVLEFNARFGDPETQAYVRLLKTDLLDVLEACVDGALGELEVEWRPGFAACVVLASGGYPGSYKIGYPISGVEEAERVPGVVVFNAGTKLIAGKLSTAGGRVLGVSAIGDTLREALDRAYAAISFIQFKDMYYRRDIGAKALATKRVLV